MVNRFIKRMIYCGLAILILVSCNSGSTNNPDLKANSVSSNSSLSIDLAATIPLINQTATTTKIFIHNNTDQLISGISYNLTSNSNYPNNPARLNSDSVKECEFIAPQSRCALTITTPEPNDDKSQGSLNLVANYKFNNHNVQIGRTINYQAVRSNNTSGLQISKNNIFYSSNLSQPAYLTVYVYNLSNQDEYSLQSVKLSNPKFATSNLPEQISPNQVMALEIKADQFEALNSILNAELNLTALNLTNQLTEQSGSKLQVIPTQNSPYLISGLASIVNTYISTNGNYSVMNVGDAPAKLGTITATNGIQLASGLNNCSSGQTLASSSSCIIYYTVPYAVNTGSGTVTINYNGNATSTSTNSITWFNSKTSALVSMVASINPVTIYNNVAVTNTITLTNVGGYPLSNFEFSSNNNTGHASVDNVHTCNTTLYPGQSCTLSANFSDTSVDLAKYLNMQVTASYAGGSTYSRFVNVAYTSYLITFAEILGSPSSAAAYTVTAYNPTSHQPYLAYSDSANGGKATVMAFNGSNWTTVGSSGFTNGAVSDTSLVFSSNGTPYLGYSDASNGGKVSVMTYNGSNWVNVGSQGFSSGGARYISMAINPQDNSPYIIYSDAGNSNKAVVKRFNGADWIAVGINDPSSISGTSSGASYNGIAFSSQGTPYIVYTYFTTNSADGNKDRPFVGKLVGNQWVGVGYNGFTSSFGKLSNDPAFYTTIAVNADEYVYVAYQDSSKSNKVSLQWLPTQTKTNPAWWQTGGSLGFSVGTASDISLAVNPANKRPYLSYKDSGSNDKVVVQACNNTACTSVSGSISWTSLNTTGLSSGIGSYTSLAFDSSINQPFVAYVDAGNANKAMVKQYNGNSWVNLNSGASDSYLSIAYNPGNYRPYIAYSDSANESKVTVITYTGSSWQNIGIPGFSTGAAKYTSIAIHPTSNQPYVAYTDAGNSNKVMAKRYDGSNWVNVASNDISTSSGSYVSFAFEPITNTPALAFSDATISNKAVMKKYNGTNWISNGSAISPGAASYISLAFNPLTRESYVAFSDGANSDKLHVMRYSGTGWLDVGSSSGFSAGAASYISLVFDSSGTPYVAYSDASNAGKATVMKFNGTQWEVVGNAGFSIGRASYTSIAINASGVPYVTFSDAGNNGKASLVYLQNGSWISNPIGKIGFSTGETAYNGIIFNRHTNLPYMIYQDTTTRNPTFAYFGSL